MIEINNLTSIKINHNRIKRIAQAFFNIYPSDNLPVSLALIGDTRMRQINFSYRGQDKSTDVLSFPDLMEIVISLPMIKKQAQREKRSFLDELDFVLVHGLLHLVGFNDDTEKKRLAMIERGNNFLKNLK